MLGENGKVSLFFVTTAIAVEKNVRDVFFFPFGLMDLTTEVLVVQDFKLDTKIKDKVLIEVVTVVNFKILKHWRMVWEDFSFERSYYIE